MEKNRIVLLIVAIAAAIGCLAFMGVQAFGKKIYCSRSCDWANIDNIELRAHVDIPDIVHCDCHYDESARAKESVFDLDRNVDLSQYIRENRFNLLSPGRVALIADNTVFDKHFPIYFREGETQNERYKMVLNPRSRKLWIYLKYLD